MKKPVQRCRTVQDYYANNIASDAVTKRSFFDEKKINDIFSYLCSKHRWWVHIRGSYYVSIHNLCFRAKIMYPCITQFYYMKVWCKGVNITWICKHDVCFSFSKYIEESFFFIQDFRLRLVFIWLNTWISAGM